MYIFFSHIRQWMIEQAHEIQLWMLRVYYISRQLYYIGHVTSIVFHCFQGRPYHLAPLTSLWRHDFSPDTHSATDRRSMFRNLFVHCLMNLSFMASLGFYMIWIPLWWNGRIFNGSLWKSLIIFFTGWHYILWCNNNDMVDHHPSERIVKMGYASTNSVYSGWSVMYHPHKQYNIYIIITPKWPIILLVIYTRYNKNVIILQGHRLQFRVRIRCSLWPARERFHQTTTMPSCHVWPVWTGYQAVKWRGHFRSKSKDVSCIQKFLWRQRNKGQLRELFVRCPFVCCSVCHALLLLFMPPEGNLGCGDLVFVMSVTLWQKLLTLTITFET